MIAKLTLFAKRKIANYSVLDVLRHPWANLPYYLGSGEHFGGDVSDAVNCIRATKTS